MASSDTSQEFVPVGELEETAEGEPHVTTVDGQPIAVFRHEGEVFATDLRCPHMGFPLADGTVEDGILTCPWHHARFELSCGDTLDPFADDVDTYPTEVRDGTIYVQPRPKQRTDPVEHWLERLDHGLQENIDLIVAKSVLGLNAAGVSRTEAIATGVEFGTQYRQSGWGRGLTTLGVMANLAPVVEETDAHRALYVGLTEVADNTAGQPPFFEQEPLANTDVPPERLIGWFRENIEVRDEDGAERVLRAAIQGEYDRSVPAEMLLAAATDHLYLDTGHRLDFINKAFEILDHVGWAYADAALPSLVPGLARATRAEEQSSWRQPIDVAALCFEATEQLPELLDTREAGGWREPDDFVETLLGENPEAIQQALLDAIESGATAEELAKVVTYAGARRVAQFGTTNEFGDWDTVHHTYTYLNAVHGMSRRVSGPVAYRALFDGAMNVYLDRFLNTPPVSLPDPSGDRDPDEILEELLMTFETEAAEEVNRAGRLTAEYLTADGSVSRLKRRFGHALLREDVGFHTRQNLEAAFTQYDAQDDPDRANVHLIATARYLAAHTPTRRSGEQTFQIAQRLHQGDRIHERGLE